MAGDGLLEEQTRQFGQPQILNEFSADGTRGDWLGPCARRTARVKRPVCRGEIFFGRPAGGRRASPA